MAPLHNHAMYSSALGGHLKIFSIQLYHGGEFTKFHERKYIKGKQTYVELLDIDTFSVHDIDELIENLGYLDEDINEVEFWDDSGYESSESDDIDFFVYNDNILDDVEVNLKDFNANIDVDAEGVGGKKKKKNVAYEDNDEREFNEVLNNKALL
ncbi:unnamed protein product [Lactuca saligna]|uniref:PB1-like domain-containing protein n=1 Tax=Lactuca saligna TaxID=75948 RepID=A0AA35ZFN4_LACSI|nr:unnamed protein product [Lactuca saligna]